MCDDKTIYTIESTDFLTENSSRIYEFMLQKKLCDVEIVIGQQKLYYHSVVLAAGSEYFKNIFFFDQKDSVSKCVVMNDEDSASLQRVIQFFYTGKIEIAKEKIADVLSVASKLIAKTIIDEFCYMMTDYVDVDNCLDLYDSEMSNVCEEFKESVLDFIKMNFKEVSESPKFLKLGINPMIDFISSEDMDVPSESVVFEAVKRWMMHDYDGRKTHSVSLMKHVRLPLVPLQVLFKEMQPFCDSVADCQNYFLQAIQYHTLPNNVNTIDAKHTSPRSPTSTVLVAGGWNNGTHNSGDFIPAETIDIYDTKNKNWVKLMDTGVNRRGCALGLLKNELIFAGGMETTLNTVESVNLTSRKKTILPPMLERRLFATGTTNDEYFYVFGGCRNFPSNMKVSKTVEKLDFKKKSWSFVSPMITPRYACGGVKLGNEFYLIGGVSDRDSTNVTEAYCFYTNKWRRCSSMNHRRFGPGVAALNGQIYALGGALSTNGWNAETNFQLNTLLSSVERYDPKTNTWTFIANLSNNRYLIGAGIMAGKLVIIGGANGATALNLVEEYDAEMNSWKTRESIVLPREFCGVFNVPMKYLKNN